MILIGSHIRNMLGGETGKITCGRIKEKFRTSNKKEFRFLYSILIDWEGADCKVVGTKS
jgi:hypothetical protein